MESLSSKSGRAFARYALPLFDSIHVRDSGSLRELEAISNGAVKVLLGADIVFSELDMKCLPTRSSHEGRVDRILLFVDAGPAQFMKDRSLWRAVSLDLRSLFPQASLRILGQDARTSYDYGLVHEFKETLSGDAIAVRPTSVEELWEMVQNCDMVISRRMHPLILGMIAGVECWVINPSKKVSALMEDLDGTWMEVETRGSTDGEYQVGTFEYSRERLSSLGARARDMLNEIPLHIQ